MVYIKYLWLIVGRGLYNLLKKLPTVFSYSFLGFSVIFCLIILFPSCFNKMPVISYFISEGEFPTTYKLTGNIKIVDEDKNIINKNVEVFVGGYSTSLESEDFHLTFSAPTTDEVYVVIRYEVNGKVYESTNYLEVKNEDHLIAKEFIIYAGNF